MMHNFFLISEDPHKIWFNEADIRNFFFVSRSYKNGKKKFFIKKKNNFSGSEIKFF